MYRLAREFEEDGVIQAISAAAATDAPLFAMALGIALAVAMSAGRAIGRIGGDPAEMIVAKGNPKGVATIGDLVRSDVRTSMPDPVNEGFMQFYGRKVIERHGIWPMVATAL